MKYNVMRYGFTTFVLVLIVLPIPPSTIVGILLATNKKTGKYMDRKSYIRVMRGMIYTKRVIYSSTKKIANSKQKQANKRLNANQMMFM